MKQPGAARHHRKKSREKLLELPAPAREVPRPRFGAISKWPKDVDCKSILPRSSLVRLQLAPPLKTPAATPGFFFWENAPQRRHPRGGKFPKARSFRPPLRIMLCVCGAPAAGCF